MTGTSTAPLSTPLLATATVTLLLAVAAPAPLVAEATSPVASPVATAKRAYQAEDFAGCLSAVRQALAAGHPARSEGYRGARCAARAGHLDEALELLQEAVAAGFWNAEDLESHPDLAALQDDPRWDALRTATRRAYEATVAASNAELKAMYDEDQASRRQQPIDWDQVTRQDRKHRKRVKKMLRRGEVSTALDYYHAGLIFQHGEKPADYELARDLAQQAVELDPSLNLARWLTAAAQDRYLWSLDRPQWYGTQSRRIDGRWTMEPIDADAITEDQRLESNVPTLEEARARLAQRNGDAPAGDGER